MLKKLEMQNKKKQGIGLRILGFLLYFLAFFPYLTPIDTGTDLQLYCLIAALLVILFFIISNELILNRSTLVLLMTVFLAIAVGAISGFSFTVLRGIANYFSIAFIAIAVYNYEKRYDFDEKYVKAFIWIWFFVGAIQTLTRTEFFDLLIASARTSAGRGVYGLANEPSFYGLTMALILILVKDFTKNKLLYVALCIIQTIIFAQSAMGIIAVAIVLFMYYLGEVKKTPNSFGFLFAFIVAAIIAIVALVLLFPEKRAVKLLIMLFNGSIFEDVSFFERFSAIAISFERFLGNYCLPGGFNERLMSGFGAVLAELGILGIPMICVVSFAVGKSFKYKKSAALIAVLFFIFMLSAIQLAHPLVAVIVGKSLAKNEKEKRSIK